MESVRSTYKFGWIPDQKSGHDDQCFEFPNVYAHEITTGPERLVIAPSTQHISIMLALLEAMPEPFYFLYVLVVPHGEAAAGRYQSPDPVSKDEAELFLSRFKDFLEHDGRHHFWIKSAFGPGLLAYDRHNVIYAYERVPEFEVVVAKRGLTRVAKVQLPFPHAHHYNEIFDDDERELLRCWEWDQSPLQEDDE